MSIERDYGYVKHHPLAEAYIRYIPPPHNRPTWDLTSVLFAVLDDREYFDISPPGKVTVEPTASRDTSQSQKEITATSSSGPSKSRAVLEALVQLSSQPPQGTEGKTR